MREIDLNTSDLPNDGSSAWYRQGRGTPWHEIVNKIDLARAYQEMGDRNAARQVLQEVMREKVKGLKDWQILQKNFDRMK